MGSVGHLQVATQAAHQFVAACGGSSQLIMKNGAMGIGLVGAHGEHLCNVALEQKTKISF